MSRNVYMIPGTPGLAETPGGLARAGDVLHVRVSGTTMFGRSWSRGESFHLDADDIAHSVNRHGESFLDRELRDPDGKLGIGPWPESEDVFIPGTPEFEEAAEAARREAHAMPTEQQRLDALQAVRKKFGAPTSTQHTHLTYKNGTPTEQQAREQDLRIRQNAVRNYGSAYTPAEREA